MEGAFALLQTAFKCGHFEKQPAYTLDTTQPSGVERGRWERSAEQNETKQKKKNVAGWKGSCQPGPIFQNAPRVP